MKRWKERKFDRDLAERFMQEWGMSRIQASLLLGRGVKDLDSLRRFMYPEITHLLPPASLTDMDRAVSRLREALGRKEKVLIFGDYDVDGITSVAIVKETFDRLGLESYVYIPSRIKEGYGLNENVLDFARQNQCALVVCVDTGTSDHQIIDKLAQQGREVIILDHHNIPPGKGHPAAVAFINPRREDCTYAFKDVSSAVLAFKLSWALLERIPFEFLDLVCLSVICDVCPLIDENRIFVKQGLKFLRATPRPGLRALMESARISPFHASVFSVGYIIGPRLNASGRLAHAGESLKLLLADSHEEARSLASLLEDLNKERKAYQNRIYREAKFLVERDIDFARDRILVLQADRWHVGVLGIVASRISQEYNRPSILVGFEEDLGKGSGRSIESFDITQALSLCGEFLQNFGGHSGACGLSIEKKYFDDFKGKINSVATELLRDEDLYTVEEFDVRVDLKDLNQETYYFIKHLEPFGEKNPQPVFLAESVKITGNVPDGNAKRPVFVQDRTGRLPAFIDGKLRNFPEGQYYDILFSLNSDDKGITLKVKDIRPAES